MSADAANSVNYTREKRIVSLQEEDLTALLAGDRHFEDISEQPRAAVEQIGLFDSFVFVWSFSVLCYPLLVCVDRRCCLCDIYWSPLSVCYGETHTP